MQHSFRGPRSSPSAVGSSVGAKGGDAYDSFIDFDGFPAAANTASFASSPSHSAGTRGTNNSSNINNHALAVRMMDHNASSGGWTGSKNVQRSPSGLNNNRLAMMTSAPAASAPVVDWPDSAPAVDWPVEESENRLDHNKRQPSIARDQQQLQLSTSRDQQIFRRKKGGGSGSASTPSYSSTSRGSTSSVVSGRGGGNVVFESYEQATSTNSNSVAASSASRSRDFGSGLSQNRSTSILDNIVEAASRVEHQPAPLANNSANTVHSQSRNWNNRNDVASEYSNSITQTQSRLSKSSFGNHSSQALSKRQMQSPPSEQQSAAGGSFISPQSVIRKTGVVNKLVSLFSPNKQQQQNQSQQGSSHASNAGTATTSTNSGLQHLKQTITAGVQFHVPMKQSQNQVNTSFPPTKSATSSQQLSNPNNLSNNNTNPHDHPAISPSRSNAQSSVTGYSGDSSSYKA
mmetsp:Transcript_17148/g.36987  ORF Transcript_17148/g.36987 Transcript_17148/m.36987 type:complete len:459 (-) Transcript_17148:262-1638(-)